ncbi:hypothetical protein [Natronococcus occultus]|uniref:DUF8048 domain-containing protein n=1 Tax=Natronococcus occultus SP4 TaxID=694430 RepID=L0JT20_9EURY|nr:hypothetical protein [Natronococcus occultus]AGB36162.1 hypothetical protein Natoc_0291 [Natronococcus occultus SP4]
MSDDQSIETGEADVSDDVLERIADRTDADEDAIADALVVLHSALIGRHAEFEREYDYVTVDGTRAYRVPESVWDDLRGGLEFDDEVADAVELAHTEQARLAFADAVDVDERFGDDDRGVVVGIDTAEEF